MAGGIFAVLDDIAVLLDDVAVMGKLAMRKTAGILGDDLAVNAEKATGFSASRELPVLWAITKASFFNKLIILPLAFLLSAYAPWLIVPVLLLGGIYLSYEGVEKIYHLFTTGKSHSKPAAKSVGKKDELLKIEAAKIKSAVHTDFILSVEIIMITLGTVMGSTFVVQVLVVSLIALLATVGVYGVVALLVRMDDVGLLLTVRADKRRGWWAKFLQWSGNSLIIALPWVIRGLSIVGTVAMLMVGGGMFTHNVEMIHSALDFMPLIVATLLCGVIVGSIILSVQLLIQKIVGIKKSIL